MVREGQAMIEHVHPEGEPTPTVRELYERKDGSAEVATWTTGTKTKPGVPSTYRLTDKGHRLLGEIMRRNAIGSFIRGSEREEGVESVKMASLTSGEGKRSGRKDWTES